MRFMVARLASTGKRAPKVRTGPQTIPEDLFKVARDSQLTRKKKAMESLNGVPMDSHPETKHLLLMFAHMLRQERRVHPDRIIEVVSVLLEAAYKQATNKSEDGKIPKEDHSVY